MRKNWVVWAILITGIVCLVAISQPFVVTQPLRAILFNPPTHYLYGNTDGTEGFAVTAKGQQGSSFFGSIGFKI